MSTGLRSDLKNIVIQNRQRQRLAEQVNRKAGKVVFRVWTDVEITNFIYEKIEGATNQLHLRGIQDLLLPSLDEDRVAAIVEKNPEQIQFGEQVCKIKYPELRDEEVFPELRFSMDGGYDFFFADLPDTLVLPSGRRVVFVFYFQNDVVYRNKSLHQLQNQVKDLLNNKQLYDWAKENDLTPRRVRKVFNLKKEQYGNCVMTKDPLYAYGGIVFKKFCFDEEEPWFVYHWCTSPALAQDYNEEADRVCMTFENTGCYDSSTSTSLYNKQIAAFAELIMELNRRPIRLLKRVLKVPYGASCQQEVLLCWSPKISETDIGQIFAHLTDQLDILRWIQGAQAYIRFKNKSSRKESPVKRGRLDNKSSLVHNPFREFFKD